MIESLISDLAYIMLLAAVVTLLFKWIKQPIVLGYIVAGFLASPNFEPLPSLTTAENIDFWAELGIVILLFTLGLEFSFKKLMSCGGSAIITAMVVIFGMLCTGFCVGHLLGFSHINSMFLGGMISMQSTTIIIKALGDLGLRHKKFASQVLGVLIVEDLFAVLLMVVLSSIAVNKTVEGGELLLSMAKLVFFLVIWFLVGTYVLPTFLNKVRRMLTDETLLVLSMGLCLGMAVFSVSCGFSLALGAFVMGSILAGTSYAERIEHVLGPVKNLFGAVFFISVGMMVNPAVIAEYWRPILMLSAIVICGGLLFGTGGMLLTGQTLKVAIQSGFTLTQIGEFSFIIATLGTSLGVLDSSMYPIIVAVSVITTFTTPYFIRMADPVYGFVARHLPERWQFLIDRYSTSNTESASETRRIWQAIIKRYAWRMLLYGITLIAIVMISDLYIRPLVCNLIPGFWGRLASCALTIVLMSPFILGLTYHSSRRSERRVLMANNARAHAPLVAMTLVRLLICTSFVVYVIGSYFGVSAGIIFGVSLFVLALIFVSRKVRHRLARIESRFLDNLNERELRRTGEKNNLVCNMHMAYGTVGYDFPYVGDRLCISNVGRKFKINIASIQRGGEIIPVPGADERLFPGDVVGVIGTEENISAFMNQLEQGSEASETRTGKEDVEFTSITLSAQSPLPGKTLEEANLRNQLHTLVVAIERAGEFLTLRPNEAFREGDTVWLVAQPSVAKKLV
ncbi:MAG: sodium:proton antiporter [Bacteroides sp.]|nr:sodium:proton antiporter [Bacteroidales bacterium]MBD5325213.1 sodium:proton antiporter [Bacteroides sp.]MBD5326856.1 sodium:proton antiporter [Bacteroides sp.]MBD5415000.1 sodium:proton antiporter [Bacteroides sp.]MDE6222087.1 cation:proton antiporter [Muribaculaceae bacterium]